MNRFVHPTFHVGQNHNQPPVSFNNDNIPRKDVAIVMNQKHKSERKCVIVDSRDRNTSTHPDAANFPFHFDTSDTFNGASLNERFKNIKSIRLVECIVPEFDSTSVPYLTLVIPELQDSLSGTNDILSKAFTVLLPDRVFSNMTHCRTDGMPYCCKEYNPPISSFKKFTLKFYKPDGSLHTFGSGEVTLVFEFEMEVIENTIKHLL